ncbi:unnamed protein product [Amaranthus hypochondriacus]
MADLGISIVEKLIKVIGSELIKEICYLWDYQSELEKLEKTIIIIKAVLVDAETKRDLSMAQQGYISDLKAAVYDADDLFDELFTLVKLNEIDGNRRGKLFEKVRAFFSSKQDKVSQAKQMSGRVKKIRKQLDTVAGDYNKYNLSINYTPIVRRRQDTCSYDVEDIIGRDSDREAIISDVFNSSANDHYCFLSIVGVGGLGKTALAQLVFQDVRFEEAFDLLLWVCVSDQDGGQFDVKTILCKILESVDMKLDSSSSMEFVKKNYFQKFCGKKYLLVLDDVWNDEDSRIWNELKYFLGMGARGSRIVITTRSEKTASIVGSKYVHKLKGLSQKDSKCLFEMIAFEGEKDEELVKIGENIVKKLSNNPLAIRVVGSLLKGQEKSMWESIEKSGLGEISEASNMIFPTLKLSYYNLTPSLKSCFSYCALFPKDFVIDKQMLIYLWLAQGYIVSLDGGQSSVEDAAEKFFSILLQRCFFRDVKKNNYGDVQSLKMHDLMYDVAKDVAKEEICVATSDQTENISQKIRHLYVENTDQRHLMFRNPTKIRSYFSGHLIYKKLENMTALRILVVNSPSRILVSSLEKLLLLRFLKLNDHSLVNLPDSFTRIYNLQTLYLSCRSLIELPKDFSNLINLRHFFLRCDSLKELPEDFSNLINLRHLVLTCSILIELPKDFSNLINLRHLDISHCRSLIRIPLDMDKLTNLRVLSKFVRGYRDPNNVELIETLTEIKGDMHVKIGEIYEYVDGMSGTEEDSLKNMKHLTKVIIEFEDKCIAPEAVLKNLQPSPKLKSLMLQSYNGTTIPWSEISFPHTLAHIEIKQFRNLERLPVLSKLPHLKSLVLNLLNGVEYLEEVIEDNYYWHREEVEEVEEFFPSLESLEIKWMFKLKGWWKKNQKAKRFNAFPRLSFLSMAFCGNFASVSSENLPELQLPCLRELHIERCGNFVSNLVCPRLEKLKMDKINEKLLIICENSQVDAVIKSRVSDLKSLRTNCLTGLTISNCIDWEEKNFSEFKEEFKMSCASSLQSLAIENCEFITRLSGLEQLTALRELTLDYNLQLRINEDDEEPWKSFQPSLRKLKFSSLKKMKNLPKGMQYLTSLQYLVLHDCTNLEGLPQWISCLSSLQSMEIYDCPGIKSFPTAIKELTFLINLSIYGCPDLEKICKNLDGEDFQNIKHITDVSYAVQPSREEFFIRRLDFVAAKC